MRTDGGRTDGQTERQTDMRKATVTFCSFANAPKNLIEIIYAIS